MKSDELKMITGGANISANWLNSFVRIINVFLELGRSIGSAFNYSKNKTTC